jgi:hypothetical protein
MKGRQVALLCLGIAALAVLGTLLYIQQTEEEAPEVDVPRYTADQVIAVAKAYAGECDGSRWSQYIQGEREFYDASWTTLYLGDGKWRVTKECASVTTWTFYEDTGELKAG